MIGFESMFWSSLSRKYSKNSNAGQGGYIEGLIMKRSLPIIVTILMLTSCNSEDNKIEIIAYGTSEFNEFVKNAPVSLDEAWELQLKYLSSEKQKTIGSPLFFIIDNKYIFTPYYNAKIPEVRVEGVIVDSKTGETDYVKKNIRLRPVSQFGWIKNQ